MEVLCKRTPEIFLPGSDEERGKSSRITRKVIGNVCPMISRRDSEISLGHEESFCQYQELVKIDVRKDLIRASWERTDGKVRRTDQDNCYNVNTYLDKCNNTWYMVFLPSPKIAVACSNAVSRPMSA